MTEDMLTVSNNLKYKILGCVPLPEWTGMDIITGMDYRNGHYAMALGALNVFYLYKMYFCSHMNSLHSHHIIAKLTSQGGWGSSVVGSGVGPLFRGFFD